MKLQTWMLASAAVVVWMAAIATWVLALLLYLSLLYAQSHVPAEYWS